MDWESSPEMLCRVLGVDKIDESDTSTAGETSSLLFVVIDDDDDVGAGAGAVAVAVAWDSCRLRV